MKSIVLALLFAGAAAEEGYECVDPESAWTAELMADVATPDECKAACETAIGLGEATDNDHCCSSTESDADGFICGFYSILADGLDIRAEADAVEGVFFNAWAW